MMVFTLLILTSTVPLTAVYGFPTEWKYEGDQKFILEYNDSSKYSPV